MDCCLHLGYLGQGWGREGNGTMHSEERTMVVEPGWGRCMRMMSSVWDMMIFRFLWDIYVEMSGRQLDMWSVAPDNVWGASECSGSRLYAAG